MRISTLRMGLVALAVVASVYGCGEETQTPTEPIAALDSAPRRELPICGEDTYLGELSPVLAVWQDSLAVWQSSATLDDAPVWEGGPVADYLDLLVPVLRQWRSAVNEAIATELLDALDAFDSQATTTQAYLGHLDAVLAAWETAAETARGVDFLPSLPTFAPDEFAPMLECPADTTFTCADTAGVVFEYEVTATDDCDPAPVVVCDPPSGSTFPVGTTTVSCTATDAAGNESTCSFDVTVEPTEVAILGATAHPSVLWPPNHKMVDIEFELDLENECEVELECTVLEVTSNEPIDGPGDGSTEPDWRIGSDGRLELRAERSGTGSGRVYTVLLRCEDPESGIVDETTVEVVVPHDQGH